MINGLMAFARTFWIGGIWAIGIIVAPMLFDKLDRVTAGLVVGRLFQVLAWVGLVAGTFLLIGTLWRGGLREIRAANFWLLFGMLLCTILNHFGMILLLVGLEPPMHHAAAGIFGGGFATWHAVSSLIYLVQSLMGLAYIIRQEY